LGGSREIVAKGGGASDATWLQKVEEKGKNRGMKKRAQNLSGPETRGVPKRVELNLTECRGETTLKRDKGYKKRNREAVSIVVGGGGKGAGTSRLQWT